MAVAYPAASGNWSTVSWLTTGGLPLGGLPGPADDVYANGKTIQLDTDTVVNTLRNDTTGPILNGGVFNHSAAANRSITATNGFYSTGGLVTITGVTGYTTSLFGDLLGANRWLTLGGVAGSTINWTGNLAFWSGAYNGGAIYVTSAGTVNITGNLATGSYVSAGIQYNCWGLYHNGVGTVNITGTVYGQTISCVVNASTGSINITGTVLSSSATNGYGVYSTTAGNITVIGTVDTAIPPATVYPAVYLTTGTLYFSGIAINRSDRPAIDVTKMVLLTTASTTWTFQDSGVGFKNLYTADFPALGNPLLANVRKNIAYGPVGELSGTAYMPSASSVLLNVPFDVASFGTLLMTPADFWAELLANITTPNSIGMRLKDCATVDSTGTQIASLT
jgi:hypothetical protein